MGSNWTLKDAEAQFASLAEAAFHGHPQRVTIEGLGEVVVAAASSYDLMEKRPKTFIEHIMDFPKLPEGLEDVFDDRHLYPSEFREIDLG
ncbi:MULTISPECIES: hypothetical protein [unclassified Aureimonas]|uniref:hypothetical protein n=1 Tax=unclassified Aureimonas TaxID=2615206 RepID=UPI0006FF6745|nr:MULTISPECIES: hypothetical protein [unclassified Aureimonas]KQT53814.1 hypothetical protein ASG62_11230 [Aureimonas sp. Leaf427]KQT71745.1 hypothetical protein ASG54_19930 [Aureimonas sp. Leaf460]